jgi:tetratricopeptide (TPR) repeat protein
MLVGCLLPALGEEAFFRGFLSRGLVGRYGIARGTLLAAGLFGAMHIIPSNICAALILGIACQMVFLSARSLSAPITLHVLYNLTLLAIDKLDGWAHVGLFHADGSLSAGLVALALATVAGLMVLLYQTRVRWVLPDGQPWSPGYPTAEMPPAAVAAAPRRGTAGLAGPALAFAAYLGFVGLAVLRSGPPPDDMSDVKSDPGRGVVFDDQSSRSWADLRARYDRARQLFHRGRYDEAIAEYDEIIHADPTAAWAFDARGSARGMVGRHDDAIADYTRAIFLDPETANYRANRAWAYMLKSDWARAVVDCDEALRQNPSLADAYHRRGEARAKSGNLGPALEDFDQAIRLGPTDATAHEWRACVLSRQEKWDQAIDAFTETIRLDPNRPSAYRARADLYVYSGEYDRAIADYGEVLRLSPDDVSVLGRRCYLHLCRRNYAQSLADADAVLRLKPDEVGTLTHRAWIRATCPEETYRDAKQAVADAERADRLTDGNSMWAHHTLAAAYAEAGRFGDAVKAARRTVELAPDDDKSDFEEYLRWYESGRPYRDKPSDR